MASILIVDDQPDIRRVVARLVRLAGHESTAAAGGAEALQLLSTATPDLVLLDVMMPDLDGFQVLRGIRADTRTADVPVVMFSAVSAAEMRERALSLGANDYWVKGAMTVDSFCHGLAVHLGGRGRQSMQDCIA